MFDIFLCIWYTIFMKKDMFTINKNGFSYPASRKELWGEHLWNPSYCAVTVSDRSREQVLAYIEGQKEKSR